MSTTEKMKLWAAALIFIAVVYVVAYADISPAARFGSAALGVAIVAMLVFFSQAGRDFSHFLRDAGVELRKVVWPTRQETAQLTGVVFLFLSVATLFLWVVDFFIGLLLDNLTG